MNSKMNKIRHLLILLMMSSTAFCQIDLSTVTNYSSGKAFTCITVDPAGNVWAGTNKAGLHRLNAGGGAFAEVPAQNFVNLPHYSMQSLVADNSGTLWLGHSGLGNTEFITGGLEKIDIAQNKVVDHFTPDVNAECYTFVQNDGLAAGNVSSMVLDKNGTVWAAQRWHNHTATIPARVSPGSLSYKRTNSALFVSKSTWKDYRDGNEAYELPYPAYTCKVPASEVAGTRQCESVACSNNEVWVSVYPYKYTRNRPQVNSGQEIPTQRFPARILRYDLYGGYLGELTFDSVGATPGPVFNAIYLNHKTDAWVGLGTGNGFAVKIKGCWHVINSTNLPEVFLPGARTNTNAIWGNDLGQVFIGTSKGLIVYDGVGYPTLASSYTLYTVASSGIASDNITGGFNDRDSVQWVATDKGISRIVFGDEISSDGENHTSCNNPSMNAIEDQAKDNQDYADWHSYKVETLICDVDDPNGADCNAQYVYKMMKADASLTAPIPADYPIGLNPYGAALLNYEISKLELISQAVAVAISPILSLQLLGIEAMEDADETKKVPFAGILTSDDDYTELQKSVNPFAVVPCARYELYNSTVLIMGRVKYNKYVDNTFCGNGLESLAYDPVWIYPNDKNLTITNYTAPGHFLSPGKIERRVVEDCGKVKIITIGTGRQYCGDNVLGELGGKVNKFAGEIIFKNVDLRLRAAFANQ